jgi:hypothetical protein
VVFRVVLSLTVGLIGEGVDRKIRRVQELSDYWGTTSSPTPMGPFQVYGEFFRIV